MIQQSKSISEVSLVPHSREGKAFYVTLNRGPILTVPDTPRIAVVEILLAICA